MILGGLTLYIEEKGTPNGDIILFLHGGGVGGWMWNKQVHYFSDFNCLIPDLPCHGKSFEEQHLSIDNCTDELIKLIKKKKKNKQVYVIAFSLGAQITVNLISKNPDIINKAIIVSALVCPMKNTKKMIKFMVPMVMGLLKSKYFQKFQSNLLYIDDEYFEEHFSSLQLLTSNALIDMYEENMSFQIPKSFTNANVKIMVLVGEREQGVMIKSARNLVKSNKNAEGFKIPKVGHGFSLADPNKFNKVVETWLKFDEILEEFKEYKIN